MNIDMVLEQLDELFAQHQMGRIEPFLLQNLERAEQDGDVQAKLSLINELIGYYREKGEAERSIEFCRQALELMEQEKMEGSTAYATTLLNIANACRAAGLLRQSMLYYNEVKKIYQQRLEDRDFRYASLYNNMGLLFQDMDDHESACDCMERAIAIASLYEETRIEQAITCTNLATSLLKLGRYEQAIENLNRAFSIFEMDEDRDYHYSGALSAMGEAQYLLGDLEQSEQYYKLALREIERNMGKSRAYEITLQNLHSVQSRLQQLPAEEKGFTKGMELSEAFYEEYGIPMIREHFPQYEHLIAVGLVGEGSECFGFDDEVSRDHDFGPGFCMWLTDAVYDEIGEALQRAYEELPATYRGITRFQTAKANKRVGVFRIGDFYEALLGIRDVPSTQNQWLFLEDYRLATATNGKVFRDDLGEFTRIRNGILRYYPEEVRIKKIAREAALMAQSGQYNYARMYKRGETVTASIALSEFMKHTMAMVYLLNRRYAPFYKWMHRGLRELPILRKIADILTMLAELPGGDEQIVQTIELIVAMIIAEMKKQGLTSGEDNYLDHHTDRILGSIPQKEENSSFREKLIEELVLLEWKAFDQVENEGGRADCQDDFGTFAIMRRSQYLTWEEPMLRSYIRDFNRANDRGINLIAEKYARMMETTTPTRYEQIKEMLPEIPAQKKEIIEEIVKIQVDWMEDFAKSYPKAARNARSIHTWEDHPFNTSYETYLRGELSTYSDATLDLYGRFIAKLCREGRNLAEMTMENTAWLYGYQSLADLEQKL